MTYSAKAVANAFIECAKAKRIYDVSPMKLQKLLFYAQSWSVKLDNMELFDDPIERWDYGPVVREVYREFREFGAYPIHLFATDALGNIPIIEPNDQYSWNLIDKILEVYGGFTAVQLSNMTHAPGTAWSMGEIGSTISFGELKRGEV